MSRHQTLIHATARSNDTPPPIVFEMHDYPVDNYLKTEAFHTFVIKIQGSEEIVIFLPWGADNINVNSLQVVVDKIKNKEF